MLTVSVSYLKNNKEKEIKLPGKYVICSKCDGHGKYHDESMPEVNDDSYIICEKCKGIRVVPEIDMNKISLEETMALVQVGHCMLKNDKRNRLLKVK